jgi:4-methyl-5(b-hydroxyethyl)-thiazole monophosphate biosynthesis
MKNVLILLAKGFEAYEAAVFTDVLGWADAFGDVRIRTCTAGLHRELTCAFGLRVVVDALVGELDLDSFNALAMPGGFGSAGFYEDAFSEELLAVIRRFHGQGKPVASVCVASLSLGRSGILAGRPATTYLLEENKKKQLAEMGALVQESGIVVDGLTITSSAPGNALDVAFLFLEMLSSKGNADHVRTLMGVPGRE